ncbi:alpha/beta hydrolase [Sabulilitoribacter multivorans]|uniref:Alpha/beta hydrolase n=1 Tax=Flaviramulus multivorans TaxID=1304750 RepID=A0ABS9II59_9FLAO|nr:alpha/beta hydrolase [Flaviramulus multivorans]MCF7560446.1 alpha/beta hydrolase [Flaviramulus multivorans]
MKYIFLSFCMLSVLCLNAQAVTTYTYSVKGGDTLKLDVYAPKKMKKSDKFPVLLWMHGGGFSIGARDFIDDAKLCEYAAKNGYIGVSISYRLLRKGISTGFGCECAKEDKLETFKQAAIDYLDAAAFIVENAEALQIDTTKIIAGGSSAGAEGTLNAVYMREHFADSLNKYNNVKFAGVFSCAGAIVNADYITQSNAVPTVLFHGTKDQLVPFDTAPHHFCEPEKPGYLMLDGSKIIAKKLEELEISYYFNIVKEAMHEISTIPFEDLDKVFNFFERTVMNNEVIQTKIIKR